MLKFSYIPNCSTISIFQKFGNVKKFEFFNNVEFFKMFDFLYFFIFSKKINYPKFLNFSKNLIFSNIVIFFLRIEFFKDCEFFKIFDSKFLNQHDLDIYATYHRIKRWGCTFRQSITQFESFSKSAF